MRSLLKRKFFEYLKGLIWAGVALSLALSWPPKILNPLKETPLGLLALCLISVVVGSIVGKAVFAILESEKFNALIAKNNKPGDLHDDQERK
jgi:hypothetical protein